MREDYLVPLHPSGYYHVFNHAVGQEQLFVSDENYGYFLHLFDRFIGPVANLFSYCLLPNHFHFFLATKEAPVVEEQMHRLLYRKRLEKNSHAAFLLQQFSNFFNAYTKAFNKQQHRKGKLFIEPFNRRNIVGEAAFIRVVHYIHANPVHHGFRQTVDEWPYSSYNKLLDHNKWLQWEQVISWFGSMEKFITYHQQPVMRKFK